MISYFFYVFSTVTLISAVNCDNTSLMLTFDLILRAYLLFQM